MAWEFTCDSSGKLIEPPRYAAELTINRNLTVSFERMPNRWHRFWYRALLGWTWRAM